jgi:hypothetical protein
MGNNADDTRWLDATAQAELIATREATSTELVDARSSGSNDSTDRSTP